MPNYYDRDKKRFRFTFKRLINGQEYRTSKLLPAAWNQAQADAYDRQESARIYAVASGIEKPKPEIAEALSLYLDHKIPNLKNGRKAAHDLAHLLPYIEGKRLDELGPISRKYCKENSRLSPATLHNRLAYLKAAVRYAYRHHDIGDRDYTDKMSLPTVNNKRQVYITQDELHNKLLANCADLEAAALFTLAFYTGLRWRSEILTLRREQITIVNDQAWIGLPDSKNGAPHMIPVHPNAIDALRYIPFTWGDRYYYLRFWKAREAAGLKHLRLHDERHSLASALLSSGATLGEVGQALNHDSVQSSERYSHMYPERLKELILRLPLAKKGPL
jgi:integrase